MVKSKLIISAEAVSKLSEETKAVLEEENIMVRELPYEEVVAKVKIPLKDLQLKISELKPDATTRVIGFVGDTPIFTVYPVMTDIMPLEPLDAGIPETYGNIKPVGEGELLIVKQQLVRYEGGDVAHIENIMSGETREREHRRLRKTEQFYLTEQESASEEERDLQSTERFEVQKEIVEVIKERSKLETGLNISAGYGPFIQIEASLDYIREESGERSKKAASEFSKEIINKSVSKLSEEIRKQQTLRLIEEYEEKNKHGFSGGDDHIVGVYQWVNKVYEAQVFNYGLRTMYDIMVPEPGAFVWEAMQRKPEEELGIKIHEPFTLQPQEIEEETYQEYLTEYQAVNVDPPPQEFITVAKTFHSSAQGAGEEEGAPASPNLYADAAEVPIGDDEYEAIEGRVVVSFEPTSFDSADPRDAGKGAMRVAIGAGVEGYHPFIFRKIDGKMRTRETTLDQQRKKIPVTILATNVEAYSIGVEIKCRRTDEAMDNWRNATYSAIMQAYLKQKADCEEKIAVQSMQQGVNITGRNPEANRKLEKAELKKACISRITEQYFDKFNSIEEDTYGFPQLNFSEAELEGKYIRFFEHAFEWENMVYVLYPYFWGRKSEWERRIKYEDADPKFIDFISAGAARVVVPLRLGFEVVMDHFMITGETWEGGDPGDIVSSLYVPIIEEMRAQLGAPGKEEPVPVDEPWNVTVPTSLVRLRPDGSLPRWIKDEKGNWIPAETADNHS